tara:strand:- start:37 stop:243 length:207 start_codon:yes stop_codon:yes gene_type:complete
MSNNQKVATVSCPTCKTQVQWIDKHIHRPFCSKRCQQIDFGDWATESFAIAGEPALDAEAVMQGYEGE